MCEYCRINKDGDDENTLLIDKLFGGLKLQTDILACSKKLSTSVYYNDCEMEYATVPINFCPICGRKLTE